MTRTIADDIKELERIERMSDIKAPSGWWILPAAFIGGMSWIVLFTWVMFKLMGA